MNLQKQQLEAKKFIGRRLKLSNKNLWNNLSKDKQRDIIDKYYHFFDIKNRGLFPVLNDIRNTRQALYFLISGVIFGILGSLVASIIYKFLNPSYLMDFFILIIFIIFLFYLDRKIERLSSEEFNEYRVLEYLIKLVDKDKK